MQSLEYVYFTHGKTTNINVFNQKLEKLEIQELIDSMDEDLCEAVGVTKEEIVVHVHQGKDLGVFSVSDNFNHGSGRK